MTKRPVSLTAILSDRKASDARELRAALFQRCRAASDQVADDIAGFALVVWDTEGNMRTAYNAERGNALALYFFHYNFCRLHKTLRTSPAQAAGVTDELLTMEHLCAIMDAANPPKKRGPYKKAITD
jgi:hypothetical protein